VATCYDLFCCFRYKRIWDQRLTPRGGVLSAVNSFLADADGGYGPRSGDEGILDPADALRKPYGYRCVTCNVAHMPTAADVNLANASSDDEEEEDGDQPEDGDDEDDMVDNTGEHWAQAQAEVNKLVDAAIYANGGRKFMDNGEVKELVHKLGLQWSKVLGQWWDDNAKDGSRRKIADSAVRSKLATEIHTARAVLRRASRAAAREKLGNRVLPLDESSSEVFWATLLQHPYTERAWKNLEDELRAEMGLDTWLRHREDFESAKQSIMACDDLMFTPVTFVGEIKLGLQRCVAPPITVVALYLATHTLMNWMFLQLRRHAASTASCPGSLRGGHSICNCGEFSLACAG